MKYSNVKVKKEKKGKKSKFGIFLILIGLAITAWFVLKNKNHSSFSPISIVTGVTAADIKGEDGRTNILLLGSDRRSSGVITSELTDTILVASIGRVDKDVVLISIPRDLWVTDSRGYSMKINEVYAIDGVNSITGELDRARGMTELTKIISNTLGIPIHYHALVNFQLFEDTINLLGGINVNVETAFSDYEYPVEGRENDTCGRSQEDIEKDIEGGKSYVQATPCRYLTTTFATGLQTMDGTKALQFSRSRHGTNNEDNDFARARRQQKVIMAIKDKALSLQTLINPQKIKDLYDLYAKNVDTNIDLVTLQNFYLLSQQINFDKVISVVLDDRSNANDGGLLYAPEDRLLYGGAYVLIPKTGDYTQIHAYVQKYLFGTR